MKKAPCLLLSVVLLLSMCASALAETGYFVIQYALNETLEDGVAVSIDDTPIENAAVLLVSPVDEEIFLWGYNESGELEVTVWDADAMTCMALFAVYCNMYESLDAIMDEGYSLAIILESGDEDDTSFVTIDSATKAKEAVEIILESLGIDSLDDLMSDEN